MLLKRPTDITEQDITPKDAFLNRRQIIQAAGGLALTGLTREALADADNPPPWLQESLNNFDNPPTIKADDGLTDPADAKSYNNFYEFGTGKGDPARYADEFDPYPWQISVGGLCNQPGTLSLADFIGENQLEERIYRLRCVEAWSMVIPWIGVELGKLLQAFEPQSNARYVAFQTVHRPEQMRGQRSRFSTIDYPYVEGLRLDEAMHPLSFLAIGMYGEALPVQNGAPIRLVVPWKYGFKSIKSIAKIDFVAEQPPSTWNLISPREYGFYSNVNPTVDHPRWSQARERRIGPNGDIDRIPTQLFNGYTEVADLYQDMDLTKSF